LGAGTDLALSGAEDSLVRHPSVVCAIDFSEASRGALRYATALAEHFQGDLAVLTVDHPLLDDAAASARGKGWLAAQSADQLHTFVKTTFPHRSPQPADLQIVVTVGEPAAEILQTALERRADLIVMSSHGTTGFRRWFFGSTTARVLRQTILPVLVTPAEDLGPDHLEDLRRTLHTILVPVDISAITHLQVIIAAGLAEAFDAKVLLAHVLEPLGNRLSNQALLAEVDRRRHVIQRETLAELKAAIPARLRPEVIERFGDPAHEIASIAQDRQVGAIVMGMHSTSGMGPRVGTVTSRVLCEAPVPMLALPPGLTGKLSSIAAGEIVAAT
jgi:nucleotide-binding universal stress UspA family protein